MKQTAAGLKNDGAKEVSGFTLIELLVVIAIIALLAGMLLPSLTKAKLAGQRIACKNNLKQLAISYMNYNNDNRGIFPPRCGTNRWPQYLYPTYHNVAVLLCPTDANNFPKSGTEPDSNNIADFAPRTYMINGFNDYFSSTLDSNMFKSSYMGGTWLQGMPEREIHYPADTIIFGEKKPVSTQYYMDFDETVGDDGGNDWTELNQTTHNEGSDYLFADGGARSIRAFLDLGPPVNMWGITFEGRTNFAAQINSN